MANSSSSITKQIITKLLIDTSDSLKKISDFRGSIDEIKSAIQSISNAFGVSFETANLFLQQYIENTDLATIETQKFSAALRELNKEAKLVKIGTPTAGEATKSLAAETALLEKAIVNIANVTNTSYRQAAEGIKRSGMTADTRALGDALRNVETAGKTAGKGLTGMFETLSPKIDNVNTKVKKSESIFSNWGKTIKSVFIGMIAFRIFQILTNFIGKLIEATNAAEEFNKQQIRLITTIRSLQRSGFDTTISEWKDVIQELSETFTQFSDQDITSAVEKIVTLGRQVGLTKDEMVRLLSSIAALATTTGVNFSDAVESVTDATASGRTTDALRELIGPMQETTLASQAVALGLADSGEAVEEYERLLTILAMAEKEAAATSGDLAIRQESLSGKLRESKETISDLWIAIGERLLPIKLVLIKTIEVLLTSINRLIESFHKWYSATMTLIVAPTIATIAVIKALSDGIKLSANDIANIYKDTFRQMYNELVNFGRIAEENDKIGNPSAMQDNADEMIDVAETTVGELKDIYDDYKEDRKDIEQDLQRDLEEIDRDGASRRAELARENADSIADIHRKAADSIAEENRSYQDALSDLARDTQQELEDAQREYREKELKAEEDFNEKLRKLREDFLYNLEDAVRERDARQILRLIREYDLKKTQMERESVLDKEQRARDYQQELEDIRVQADRKRQELAIDHARKLNDIRIQLARELREQKISYANDLRELRISLNERRRERQIQFQEQMKDLEEQTKVRLKEVIDAMVAEARASGEGGAAIYKALRGYIGPGGSVESLYKYYVSMLRATVTQSNAAFAQLASTAAATASLTKVISKPTSVTKAYPFAEGGTLIANKPTLALFGESGPERVSFNPIGRIGANENRVFGGSLPNSASGNGTLQLELLLSPDLEARIVNSSLDEFANVMVSVERMRA